MDFIRILERIDAETDVYIMGSASMIANKTSVIFCVSRN